MSKRPYSLRKSRRIFHKIHILYKRGWKKLTSRDLAKVEENLAALDQALLAKNRPQASDLAKKLEEISPKALKKHPIRSFTELVLGIAFALAAAIVIRQMWFEPMDIPSGSMRPYFQELDRLVITKTPFGLNVPAAPRHFFFNPELVKRTGVFIFTAEDMDIPDQNTTYFGIPGKRRLIKRMMGLPGDTLYFYGGKIYGMDREGNDLIDLRSSKWADQVTSIPFIRFEGKVKRSPQALTHLQMNQPLGRTLITTRQGQVFDGKSWVDETPNFNYNSFWGIGNYAMARLLTPEQGSNAPLYLELAHHPTLRRALQPETSLIPLTEEHLQSLMAHMTTSRFIVKEERAYPEAYPKLPQHLRPHFPKVPNGRYQFIDGRLEKVSFSGVVIQADQNHPLYAKTPSNIQKLFNLGIDFNTLFDPARLDAPYPNRYAFYREGNLYLLANPILNKGDPTLIAFEKKEREKGDKNPLYIPFIDQGPPLKEGKLDRKFLERFGLKVPEKGYLALGDNYANSGDSRQFGFVPEDNIRGAPSFIFWPAGKRWGPPFMPPNRWITPARLVVWTLAILITLCWFLWHRRKNRRSHFKKLSEKDLHS